MSQILNLFNGTIQRKGGKIHNTASLYDALLLLLMLNVALLYQPPPKSWKPYSLLGTSHLNVVNHDHIHFILFFLFCCIICWLHLSFHQAKPIDPSTSTSIPYVLKQNTWSTGPILGLGIWLDYVKLGWAHIDNDPQFRYVRAFKKLQSLQPPPIQHGAQLWTPTSFVWDIEWIPSDELMVATDNRVSASATRNYKRYFQLLPQVQIDSSLRKHSIVLRGRIRVLFLHQA